MCAAAETARHGIEWWEGAAGALLGALIGSLVPLLWSWWARRTERKGELRSMYVELYHAQVAMNALRDTTKQQIVMAPLYHLPLTMFERALPKLIGEGLLTDNEISGLVEYVMRAEELNRGLDLATAAAVQGEQHPAVREQWNRNCGKVGHILDDKLPRFEGRTVFEMAKEAVFRLLDKEPPEP
jgi:hypothetical protein